VFLHYLVKQEAQKLHFYLNAVCCFVNRHTKHIKILLGHSQTILHCQTINCMHQTGPAGRKLERFDYVTHMLHDYHVRNSVSCCVKNGSYSLSQLE